MPRLLRRILPVAGLVAILLTAGSDVRPASAATIELQPFASGFNSPLGIVSPQDGTPRLFIVEQGGRIWVHDGTQVLPTPFLNISSLVSCCTERGLLGLAFHPDYETNGKFYVNYTDVNGNTAIAQYTVSANPNVANTNGVIILPVAQPAANHNGGQLVFGPDGYLYIALGDGGVGADANAQDLNSLLGKILRIDVDDAAPYAVPPTNPLVGLPGRDEIWASGFRNPWRVSFDRLTGDLWIADVGQSRFEEVNLQPAGTTALRNYGWNIMEATSCYNATTCNQAGLTMPVIEYGRSFGCSITGGYRYRGGLSALYGQYIFADFCSGRIFSATSGQSWAFTEMLDTSFLISTLGESQSGELYVADYSGGAIYRIVVPSSTDDDSDGCTNVEELGQNHLLGGDRDPNVSWDFYDVPVPALSASQPGGIRNESISIADTLAVVYYIGTVDGGGANGSGVDYDSDVNANGMEDGAEYDRTASANPNSPWRSQGPNGAVTIGDAIVSLNQIGDRCTA